MAIERQPLDRPQTKATAIQSTVSEYGKIKSAVSTLRDARRQAGERDDLGPDHHQLVEHRGLGDDQQLGRGLLHGRGAGAGERADDRHRPPPSRRRRRRAPARCASSSAPGAPGRPASRRRPGATAVDIAIAGDRHPGHGPRQDQRRRRRRHRADHDRRERLAPADPLERPPAPASAFRTSGIALAGVRPVGRRQRDDAEPDRRRRRGDGQRPGRTSPSNTLTNIVDGLTLNLSTLTTGAGDGQRRHRHRGAEEGDHRLRRRLHRARQADRDRHQVRPGRPRRAASCRATAPRPACSGRCARSPARASGASALFGHLSDVGLELQGDGSMTVNATKLAQRARQRRRAEEDVLQLEPRSTRRRTASASAFASSPTRCSASTAR